MTVEELKTQEDSENAGRRKAQRKALIRFLIWKDGPFSRAQLARMLNLNTPTVSHCLAELLEREEIVETGRADSTGGRKAQLLDMNASKGAVIGVTFSSRGISSAWGDFKASIMNLRHYPFTPAEGKARALETIFLAIEEQLSAVSQVGSAPVSQIALGVSGLLNPGAGVSLAFPRFEEWSEVPLRQLVEERFGIATVLDSRIASVALAETIFGKYRGFHNALYVQLGPGLGVGIVIGGRIYRGSKLNVGEFGHTTISENGPLCYCGNYGCIESMASDSAMVTQAEAAIKEGVVTRIQDFAAEAGKITPRAIFRAAEGGDRFALNLVEKVGRILGTGIANLVNLFGPELIILGGSMAQSGEVLLDPIYATLRTKALDRMEKDVEVKTSSFGSEEAIKGALALAIYQYLARELEGVGCGGVLLPEAM